MWTGPIYLSFGKTICHEFWSGMVIHFEIFLWSLGKKPDRSHLCWARTLPFDCVAYNSHGRCTYDWCVSESMFVGDQVQQELGGSPVLLSCLPIMHQVPPQLLRMQHVWLSHIYLQYYRSVGLVNHSQHAFKEEITSRAASSFSCGHVASVGMYVQYHVWCIDMNDYCWMHVHIM